MASRVMVTVLALAFSTATLGDEQTKRKPLTAEQLDELRSLDKAIEGLGQLDARVDSIGKEFVYRCARVFGHTTFCECVAKNRPYWMEFATYVSVTSQSKQEMKYEKLSADDKKVLETTLAARNKCVEMLGFR